MSNTTNFEILIKDRKTALVLSREQPQATEQAAYQCAVDAIKRHGIFGTYAVILGATDAGVRVSQRYVYL